MSCVYNKIILLLIQCVHSYKTSSQFNSNTDDQQWSNVNIIK